MERAGRLIGNIKMPKGLVQPEQLARKAWANAVGKRIAAHSSAIALVRSRLIIEVEDAIWQRQLHALRWQILKNLQDVLGPEIVTDLEFRPEKARRLPQRAETARSVSIDDADNIQDPILRRVYKAARKKATA